jgi:alkylation response protein AidB-like acyl-CoA dehydrogenase
MSVGANRQSRECYREAFEWALKVIKTKQNRFCLKFVFLYFVLSSQRETFGKPLIKNAIIRAKLGDMSRQIEAVKNKNKKSVFFSKLLC